LRCSVRLVADEPSYLSPPAIRMRSLQHILSADSTLAGFLDRRRNELAILEHIRRNLPPALAAQVGIAAGEPPELALLAGSGAAGALLRQRIPDLVEKLAR